MILDQACEILEAFAEVNQMDDLSALEYMVKHYKILGSHEQTALAVFMDATRDNALVDQKLSNLL
jgi:hypothetical protein